MSHTWICAKCGTSAYSKCPDARNVFENDFILSHIRSVLATNIIPTSNGHEVFLNLTVYGEENPLKYAFDFLAEHVDKIKNIACDHWWFVKHDSEETQTCTCDHQHPTTCSQSFKDAQLAATHENRAYDYKDMQKNYAAYLHYVISQLDSKCRIGLYPDGDAQNRFSDALQHVRGQFNNALHALFSGEPVKPLFSIRERGDKWGDPDILNLSCDNVEIGKEILALLRDKLLPTVRAYDQEGSHIEPSLIPMYCKCAHCGEEVTGNAVVYEKKIFHQKCNRQLTKPTRRSVRLPFEAMTKEFADRLGNTYRSFGPDYDYDADISKQLTENLNRLVRCSWGVKLHRLDFMEPCIWEMQDGKKRKFNGGIYLRFEGLLADIEAVVAEIKTLNQKGN